MRAWNTLDGHAPRIIAHRGASGERPEHTLPGYALAVEQGADVIEPDLVMSRDGMLYARHDLGLARSTDVAAHAEFAGRRRSLGEQVDWWVGDFEAAELDCLRAVQPWPRRDQRFNGRDPLPRLGPILDLAARAAAHRGRAVPVYPEIKHPGYFRGLGLDPVQALVTELQGRGLTGAHAPVWLQCVDHAVLREAHQRCGNPCFALLEPPPGPGPVADWIPLLRPLLGWACGVAPDKRLLWGDGGDGSSGLVEAAHGLGLQVHAWTFRDDADPAPFASPREELAAAFALGVDALFCDFPATALALRDA